MSGTVEGGLKASKTNREKYGEDYYKEMGRRGGMNGHTGGFANNPELARRAGAKGGKYSRRGESLQKKLDEIFNEYIRTQIEEGKSLHHIAQKIGVSDYTVKKFALRHELIVGYTPQKNYHELNKNA